MTENFKPKEILLNKQRSYYGRRVRENIKKEKLNLRKGSLNYWFDIYERIIRFQNITKEFQPFDRLEDIPSIKEIEDLEQKSLPEQKYIQDVDFSNREDIINLKAEFSEFYEYNNFNGMLNVLQKLSNKAYKADLKPVIMFYFSDDVIYYTLSNKTKTNILKTLKKLIAGQITEEKYENTSDFDIINKLEKKNYNVDILFLKRNKWSQDGNFFPLLNNSNIDLSILQIYNRDDFEKTDFNVGNCLINCLELYDIDENIINYVKNHIIVNYIVRRDLKKISNIIKKSIILYNINDDGEKLKYNYNNTKYDEKIKIVLFKNHYFPLMKMTYTSFYLNNIEMLDKNFKNPSNIVGIKNNHAIRRNDRFLKSDKIVYILYKQGYFIKDKIITEIELYKYNNTVDYDIKNYIDLSNEQRLFITSKIDEEKNTNKYYEYCGIPKYEDIKIDDEFSSNDENNEEEIIKKKIIIAADYESYKDDDNKHVAFMLGAFDGYEYKKFNKNYDSQILFFDMLKWIYEKYTNEKKIIIYFHNLKYDYNFIENIYTPIKYIVEKNGQIFSANLIYKGKSIELRDSYKLINIKLGNFDKEFNLGISKKEYIPYEFYNKGNIYSPYVKLDDFCKELDKNYDSEEYEEAIKNYIRKKTRWNKNILFDHIKYMEDYLELDCKVLYEGLFVFRKSIFEITKLDIFNYLSIASISDSFIINSGCYEDIYEISGNLNRYIMNSIRGGRTCCGDNKKHFLNEEIMDFDAVSLYPSAMYRLIKENYGFPSGKAKEIDSKNYDIIKHLPYFVLEIKITNIGKEQYIPFINYVNNKNERVYTNDIEEINNKSIYLDKIELEDWIEFQKIEFDIISGFYWEVFNTKISEVIEYLFNSRLDAKNNNNDLLQKSIKLLMNSSYGKTLIKCSNKSIKYLVHKQVENYIRKNYNQIDRIERRGKNYKCYYLENTYLHSNRAHCGGIILSMSRRIMNELMNLANDNDIMIYYQDTDSCHLKKKDIKKLEKLYKKKYNRDLIGSYMGQFHNDLELNGDKIDTISKICIILGKKCYIDVIENKKKEQGYHIRMKGVGSRCILENLKNKEFRDRYDVKNPLDIYKKLFEGKSIIFDLTQGKLCLEYKDGNIFTKDIFSREIKFQ